MLFFAHIFMFLYGVASFAATAFRTSPAWESASDAWTQAVEKFFPESIFQPWVKGVDYPAPDMTRTYLVGFGLIGYSLRYLFQRHRR